MNLIKSNFKGTDRSNEISLLEYGLLVYNDKHEDNSGTQFCVYRIDEYSFGTAHISEVDINELLKGNDWIYKSDIDSFLSYVGTEDINEYLSTSLINKLADLMQYYGVENIFGTDYSPITEQEAIDLYL